MSKNVNKKEGELLAKQIFEKGLKLKAVTDLLGMSRQGLHLHLGKEKLTEDFKNKFTKVMGWYIGNDSVSVDDGEKEDEKNSPESIENEEDYVNSSSSQNQEDMRTALRVIEKQQDHIGRLIGVVEQLAGKKVQSEGEANGRLGKEKHG